MPQLEAACLMTTDPRSVAQRSTDQELPAIEGGIPVRDTLLPFARPQLGVEEEQAVVEVLRSGWVGTGPRTERFEDEFAAYVGTKEAVAVSSCTAGLYLTLHAFGLGAGDEVITSPMTFPATVNAILQAGAAPVFVDVLPGQLTIDPNLLQQAMTPRTRAILVVHLAGWPCEMDEIVAFAEQAGLLVIEDAAHALGATYRGRRAGALGDAAVFSFYATKNITTGEGGMITTDRADLIPTLRQERLHGLDLDASQRDGASYRHWEAVSMGWKLNLNDIAAAIGLAQLAKLDDFQSRRRALDARYRALLADVRAVGPLKGPQDAETSAHIFPILLQPGALRVDRDTILRGLLAENIGVGVHFRSLPLHRFFRQTLAADPQATPVASDASNRILSLPLYPGMSDEDQDDVVEALSRLVRFYET
jgi:dTDP-4-amino-4,6-dideoxygalactose transaminase